MGLSWCGFYVSFTNPSNQIESQQGNCCFGLHPYVCHFLVKVQFYNGSRYCKWLTLNFLLKDVWNWLALLLRLQGLFLHPDTINHDIPEITLRFCLFKNLITRIFSSSLSNNCKIEFNLFFAMQVIHSNWSKSRFLISSDSHVFWKPAAYLHMDVPEKEAMWKAIINIFCSC